MTLNFDIASYLEHFQFDLKSQNLSPCIRNNFVLTIRKPNEQNITNQNGVLELEYAQVILTQISRTG